MEDLPHELIAAIGDHLLPKWRCRLFMCCKLWQHECAWPQRDLFQWHSNNWLNIKFIASNVKYDCIKVTEHAYIVKKNIKPNLLAFIYYVYSPGNSDRINPHISLVIIARKYLYNDANPWCLCHSQYRFYGNNNLDDGGLNFVASSVTLYYRLAMKRDNAYLYSIYNCIPQLYGYLSNIDFNNLIKACGHMIKFMLYNDSDPSMVFRRSCAN
jgi:hypothetical protein